MRKNQTLVGRLLVIEIICVDTGALLQCWRFRRLYRWASIVGSPADTTIIILGWRWQLYWLIKWLIDWLTHKMNNSLHAWRNRSLKNAYRSGLTAELTNLTNFEEIKKKLTIKYNWLAARDSWYHCCILVYYLGTVTIEDADDVVAWVKRSIARPLPIGGLPVKISSVCKRRI